MLETNHDDLCEIQHTHPEKIQECSLHKLDDATSLALADIFKILGDKTRIKLLSLLAAEEELCVCDIAESLADGTICDLTSAARTSGRPAREIPQDRQRGILFP